MSSHIQPAPFGLVRKQFQRTSEQFEVHADVLETVGNRLLERLDVLAIKPAKVLELGCRTGYQLQALAERYPKAQIIGADPAPARRPRIPRSWPAWLRRRPPDLCQVACDPHVLPFADRSFDLVVSNLLLPWCRAPHQVFEEVSRILATGGAFLFTSAGPDTLIEYRAAWQKIDKYLHGFGLIDMHDLGDAMMAAGFAAPVLDRENLCIDYPNIDALQVELRNLGAANLASGRRRGLMSPQVRTVLEQAGGAASRFPVTLELVNGHGWKGELHPFSHKNDDEYAVSLDDLRNSLSKRRLD